MLEFAQKLTYASIGLVSFVLEKVQESVDDMVRSEKISAAEGEKIIRELMKDASAIKEEVEYQLTSQFEKIFQHFTAQREDKLEDLLKRIEYLEDAGFRKK